MTNRYMDGHRGGRTNTPYRVVNHRFGLGTTGNQSWTCSSQRIAINTTTNFFLWEHFSLVSMDRYSTRPSVGQRQYCGGQGRCHIHENISYVRLGRSGDAKTARREHVWPTDRRTNGPTDRVPYRVACMRLKIGFSYFLLGKIWTVGLSRRKPLYR